MTSELPQAGRSADAVQGHWLLARLGKRVLRPGGRRLTEQLLAAAGIGGSDVVEFAPGLGRTAARIVTLAPESYTGVDSDPAAVASTRRVVGSTARVIERDAADTGLPAGYADVVIGEAMLTLQGEKAKQAIIAEAARLLRPGGRYAIHELGLVPDELSDGVKTEIRQALARSIKVNARPLTRPEWTRLLESHGFTVTRVETAPMALLQPRRIIADEGLVGALRFAKNLLAQPDARRRVMQMRRTFRTHRSQLTGIAIIATRAAADRG